MKGHGVASKTASLRRKNGNISLLRYGARYSHTHLGLANLPAFFAERTERETPSLYEMAVIAPTIGTEAMTATDVSLLFRL
jgi:hypothetical protein